MSGEIEITLHQEFSSELAKLAAMLRAWDKSTENNVIRALKIIGSRWKAECVKRVPVDNGNLKQRILSDVYKDAGDWTLAVGTNVPYGKWLEFGTKYIAGGRVLALGDGIEITDAQAITDWPAKAHDHATGPEQMPWLRPAFNAIKSWAVEMLVAAVDPQGKGRAA